MHARIIKSLNASNCNTAATDCVKEMLDALKFLTAKFIDSDLTLEDFDLIKTIIAKAEAKD